MIKLSFKKESILRKKPAEQRKGDFVETFTGRQFWPLDPRPEDVCIEDIAHSLSMQCRFNGHCSRFYSVAEHSIIVAKELGIMGYGSHMRLYGLLHDAAEAYCCDIPRPLKSLLVGYKEMETKIQDVIYAALSLFGPFIDEQKTVKDVDDALLRYEGRELMPNKNGWAGTKFKYWVPESLKCDRSVRELGLIPTIAENKFIQMYNKLIKDLEG